MADLAELKKARTSAKREVTKAANRMSDGISLKMDPATIHEQSKTLDTKYCAFLDIAATYNEECTKQNADDTYKVVSGLNLVEYESDVKSFFVKSREEYAIFVSAHVTTPHTAHTTAQSPSTASTPSTQASTHPVLLKKREVPTFSGLRKDWVEFKSIWEKIVVPALPNKTALATELKKACSGGPAINEISNISAGADDAYTLMWANLCTHYDNVTLSVVSAIAEIKKLNKVSEDDYSGLVKLIRQVDGVYQQLKVLGQIDMITAREVNEMLQYFPTFLRKDWAESYYKLDTTAQLRPFEKFHSFLDEKVKIAKLMSDTQQSFNSVSVSSNFASGGDASPSVPYSSKQGVPYSSKQGEGQHISASTIAPKNDKCIIHGTAHSTRSCRGFKALSVQERKEKLLKAKRCFRCFEAHQRARCPEKSPCGVCGRNTHHTLMCRGNEGIQVSGNAVESVGEDIQSEETSVETPVKESLSKVGNYSATVGCHVTGNSSSSLYAIYEVPVYSSVNKAIVFCDDGADASFISEQAITKLKAVKIKDAPIHMTTLHGTKAVKSSLYEVTLLTSSGKKVSIVAFSLPQLSSNVSRLTEKVLAQIFPDFDPSSLQRPVGSVDLLIGGDYFGLHPKRELASDGHNLSVMQGEFGVCVQGSHPGLVESTSKDECVGHAVSVVGCNHVYYELASHSEYSPSVSEKLSGKSSESQQTCYSSKVQDDFILGEQLGTEVNPQCGGCKCGKCPIRGHSYSFKEEQELDLITSKLRYDSEKMVWFAGYPWVSDPVFLPDNYPAAMATLRSTEKKLASDPEWADKYSEQIKDHADRGVARKLPAEEIRQWKGPVFYLSHMALEQPKSLTTPVRIVFNSSQVYKGVSLNSFLAKGPDAYNNNLLGMLIRFRENPVVMVGDIRKMYNSVYLEELEQHTHRFLWRDLEDRSPDIWCITRVNLGDKPAGTIAIVAKDKTADLFHDINPEAADMIKYSTYTDDIVDSIVNYAVALQLSIDIDSILSKGGFRTKGWIFGGRDVPNASSEVKVVLGVTWVASEDVIMFPVRMNFSPKRRNVHVGPNLVASDIPLGIPEVLSRRVVLQQVMGVFDPFGILSPFLLRAKVLLRETWVSKLGWDDPLSPEMCQRWKLFFSQLFVVEHLKFPRCLKPEGDASDPILVILSDGSELAYGCAAYVRYTLSDGSYWCRLILAKCRIAPLNRISIPQMELNGAVLSKRCRKIIECESRIKFDKVVQLVDSETVLCMIHKLSTRFKVYEGVRIGEIQAATQGDVSCWGWISGSKNISDWVTRGKSPAELGPDSEWFVGPKFMYEDIDRWNLKFIPSTPDTPLPGEKVRTEVHAVRLDSSLFSRCSSLSTILGAVARVMSMLKHRSFKGGKDSAVSPELVNAAEVHLLKEAQTSWTATTIKLQFRTVAPVLVDGLWVVGLRIAHHSPLSPDNKPLVLVPPKHPLTRLLMQRAHQASGHRGRDATLAKFRAQFWTSRASKISASVCEQCQLCKLLNAKKLEQIMGQMPPDRLSPSPSFSSVMLDLFGPYSVRGEVQKRTTGKAWGVIFTDLCSRAVHIEVMFAYDTQAFLLALNRFAAVRGWPSVIYSDPGSQLCGASEELKRVWKSIDKDVLTVHGSKRGLQWKFGPANSPWYQGAAESLIRSAKKAINLSVGDRRLSVPEILTVFSEAANLLNERPIGFLPGPDSPLNILTPNSLLLGRSTAVNPGGYEAAPTLRSRVTLVQSVIDQFWTHWTNLYAPTLVQQSKWLYEKRGLKLDDVVIVADARLIKGEYRLARVSKLIPSADGVVRRVKVAYKNFKVGEVVHKYSGVKDTEVERSVQTLALLVPVTD